MRLRSRTLLTTTVAAVSVGLALTSATGPADAAKSSPSDARTLDSSVLAPFQIAVRGGTVWWTDGFKGTVTRLKNGKKSTIVSGGAEGVAVNGKKLAYSVTTAKTSRVIVRRPGHKSQVVKVRRFEAINNPDGNVHYGIIKNYVIRTAAKIPDDVYPFARYTGIVDSHPYSSYTNAKGSYIGEAAGNDILWIDNNGKIKTVAVLPPTEVTITQAAADELHLDACFVGLKYWLEPVPTDVEVGPNGKLYVSSLPGGPESAALGANGRVYQVSPSSGKVKLVAGGFIGTVDLAVANNGDIYVAELFAGQISKIKAGKNKAKPFLQVNMPGAVEWTKSALYYTENAVPAGKNPKGKVIRLAW